MATIERIGLQPMVVNNSPLQMCEWPGTFVMGEAREQRAASQALLDIWTLVIPFLEVPTTRPSGKAEPGTHEVSAR